MEHGRRVLQRLCQRADITTGFRAKCMEACATWSAESQTEHPKVLFKILNKKFKKVKKSI